MNALPSSFQGVKEGEGEILQESDDARDVTFPQMVNNLTRQEQYILR
jgi:hypothetical protein